MRLGTREKSKMATFGGSPDDKHFDVMYRNARFFEAKALFLNNFRLEYR